MISPRSRGIWFGMLGIAGVVLSLAAVGCGGGLPAANGSGLSLGPEDELGFEAADSTFTDPAYRLGPGDEIQMNFLFDHSLDNRIVIRPDGGINLPIIGDMNVAGLTPGVVCDRISKAYGQYYTNPQLSINLTKFAPPAAYVLGEVRYPKSVEIRPGMTVLSAIAEAGGQTDMSHFSSTVLIRRVSGTRAVARRINLTAFVKGKKGVGSDLYLQDYDIIYVPKSFLGRMNSTVELIFGKITSLPVAYLKGWEAFHTGRVYNPPVSERDSTPSGS